MAVDESAQLKQRIASGFSDAAATYDTVLPYFATFARHLIDVASPIPSDRVLDVACGRGAMLRELLRRCSFETPPVGIDIAPGMVDQLREDGVDAELRVMDVEQLGFEDGSFDLVTCGFGVFFFPDPVKAQAEIRRVVAPGGRFVASLFTNGTGTYPWHREILAELGRPPRPPSPVSWADGLVDVLAEVGFGPVEVARELRETFIFRDVDQFVAWQSSHGGRILLDALGSDGRARYRDLCAERLEAHRTDAGYEMTIGVTNVVAMTHPA